MKLAKYIITLITIVCGYAAAVAQPQSVMKSYNFSRALEEAQKGNKADALDFFQKEVAENPDNGYAYLSMAVLQADAEDYSSAMTSIEKAIKKLPKKDKEWTSRAYASRAHLYTIAGDTISALADFAQAIKINPKDADIYETLGQLFYELKRYNDADAAYRKIIELNPTSVMGYMGIGRH